MIKLNDTGSFLVDLVQAYAQQQQGVEDLREPIQSVCFDCEYDSSEAAVQALSTLSDEFRGHDVAADSPLQEVVDAKIAELVTSQLHEAVGGATKQHVKRQAQVIDKELALLAQEHYNGESPSDEVVSSIVARHLDAYVQELNSLQLAGCLARGIHPKEGSAQNGMFTGSMTQPEKKVAKAGDPETIRHRIQSVDETITLLEAGSETVEQPADETVAAARKTHFEACVRELRELREIACSTLEPEETPPPAKRHASSQRTSSTTATSTSSTPSAANTAAPATSSATAATTSASSTPSATTTAVQNSASKKEEPLVTQPDV